MPDLATESYASLLRRYTSGEELDLLTEGTALGDELIAAGIAPMEIKAIHDAAVADVIDPASDDAVVAAHRLLLDVLVSYGTAYSAQAERLLAEADAAEQAHAEGQERADHARLALLASVSHELGNPLTIVKANVASIRQFLEERGGWHEDLNEREADVTVAVNRMMALREELLAASRDEQRELEIVPLPTIHVLRRVARWGRLSALGKVAITEEYPPVLPYVLADEGALLSILTNLVSNAVRYTPAGGTVSLRGRSEDSNVVFEVADSGIGISEEDQFRIYERFYRTEEAKSATTFGVGLGLAITRDLVSSLAGTIEVQSEVGVGSTFKVTLPAIEPPAEDD